MLRHPWAAHSSWPGEWLALADSALSSYRGDESLKYWLGEKAGEGKEVDLITFTPTRMNSFKLHHISLPHLPQLSQQSTGDRVAPAQILSASLLSQSLPKELQEVERLNTNTPHPKMLLETKHMA